MTLMWNAPSPQRLDDYHDRRHKQNLIFLSRLLKVWRKRTSRIIFQDLRHWAKTTLATVIANELGAQIKTTSGPAIARTGTSWRFSLIFNRRCSLFIDEIHRLNRSIEEILYPAMEDFQLDIVIGKGPAARSIRLDIPHFTLVVLSRKKLEVYKVLCDRLVSHLGSNYYSVEDLAEDRRTFR